jgi:hypothetical protein
LQPGRHMLSLRAANSPPIADRELVVESGNACEVSFTEPAPR